MLEAAKEWEAHHPPKEGDEGQWGGRKKEDMMRRAIQERAEVARTQWEKEEGDTAQEWEEWQQQ